ncbi:MAG: hypothetical protein ACO1SX_12930 [Actinomycetota bacterium]
MARKLLEIVEIAVADLLVDPDNARLKGGLGTQQAAILALAQQQGKRLIEIADDIVEHGLDPTTLVAVIPTDDQRKRFIVGEGNRRVTTLKGLETPSLILAALDGSSQKKFLKLSQRFAQDPITSVRCVIFTSEKELEHWQWIRHTGANDGRGLVEWGADEKDRFTSRHGTRSPAGQLLDFIDGVTGGLNGQTEKKLITNITRLISTPDVRERLGIELSGGQVSSWYPAEEITKALTHVINDLATEAIQVKDIYHASDRRAYAAGLPTSILPDPATRLATPVPLPQLQNGNGSGASTTPKKKPSGPKKKPTNAERTALIPKTCLLNIASPRINNIYIELLNLSVDQYPNACSVSMRVFVELTVDHYIDQEQLMTEPERRNLNLARRLKRVAEDMRSKAKINAQLEAAVQKIADGQFALAASTPTFNQYVHNQYVFPKPTELRVAWDELQAFIEKLWA